MSPEAVRLTSIQKENSSEVQTHFIVYNLNYDHLLLGSMLHVII